MDNKKDPALEELLQKIIDLPADLHGCGSVSDNVLRGIYKHCSKLNIIDSIETGSGKTTLLFSHLSKNHNVFALNIENSVDVVKSSDLLNTESYNWINGPTQQTLTNFKFNKKYQLAYLDGPHGFPFPELEYYYIYPHIENGGLLILDDILIPTIHNLYKFIRADEMFKELEVIDTTAFFQRTKAKTFDPLGDGWWLQGYNKNHYPVPINMKILIKKLLPNKIKHLMKQKFFRK